MRAQAYPVAGVNPKRPVAGSSAPVSQPRFAGVGEAVSGFISLIDQNRVVELASSDGLGMLVPRTGVAAAFRGKDDARETLIREGAGLFCVALLSGLSNQFMVRVLGNRVGVYNPHGTPAKAWIGAHNLRTYGNLYAESLSAANSVEEARSRFLSTLLDRLESGDKQLSIHGRLAMLKNLSAKDESGASAKTALAQMVRDLHGDSVSAETLNKYQTLFHQGLNQGKFDSLREKFLKDGWGRLSQNGKESLKNLFTQKALGASSEAGLQPIDAISWDRVNELEQHATPHARQTAFLKQRLKISLKQLQQDTPEFMKKADRLALEHGLTSVVNLNDAAGTEALMSGQSRQTVLKEVKAFLDHYVDRAGFEVKEKLKSQILSPDQQRKLLHTRLFAPSAKGLRRLFPQAEDGLVTATLKAKAAYAFVPITVAIAANGITTFMNNYITQKKYQGRVFFPGEEVYLNPPQHGAQVSASTGARPGVQTAQTGRWA